MPAIYSMARIFSSLQSFVAGLYGVLLPLAVLALLTGNVLLLYVAVFRDIDPVAEQRVSSVEPVNRYLDRDSIREFKVTREICSIRNQQVEVVRAWTEDRHGDLVRPVVTFTSQFQELRKGCHLIPAVQAIPETLPPGQYVLDTALRSCNALNQCVSRHLAPIPFTVVGGMWRNLDIPMPPPMPPPPPTITTPGLARGGFSR